jgi:ABC-2 type transport system ATP-binding protein
MAGVRNMIEVKNISKNYKVTDIFERLKGEKIKVGINNVSFEVKEGEVFSIIGLNGAGKTTIMKSILGLITPDSGEIRVFGERRLRKEDYYRIGYLPEISYYPKEVKLKDLMEYYADLYDMDKYDRKNRVGEIMELLNLHKRTGDRLEKFSKGMLQRVGLAQAIMNEPEILFLDEPMSGLDPLGRKHVMDIIRTIKRRGTTVILNTHILSDVEKMGDKIAIVDNGEIKKVFNYSDYAWGKVHYMIEITVPYRGFAKIADKYIKRVEEDDLNEMLRELTTIGVEIKSIAKGEFRLEDFFIDEIGGKDRKSE